MFCPNCNTTETKVLDSRIVEEGRAVRRRRECDECDYRFTTFERKGVVEMMVIKKDGSKEPYNRSKIKKAMMIASVKRNIGTEQIEMLINNLEVSRSNQWSEMMSSLIGDDILRELKKIDIVAYVRFASVYKKFDTMSDFQNLIE